MDILITPRLTLRPPIDWDLDDINLITRDPAHAARVISSARYIIVRERAVGWVDASGLACLDAALAGQGYEAELQLALPLRDMTAASRFCWDHPGALLNSAAIQAAAPA